MKIESSFLIIFILAVISKFFQLQGSNLFLVTALLMMAFAYFLFAFYLFCDKIIVQQNLWYSIISGILLSAVPIGILFKLMYWYDWKFYLLTASAIAFLFYLTSILLNSKASEQLKVYYKNMIKRTAIMTLICVILLIIPINSLLNIEISKLNSLYSNNPTQLEYKKKLEEFITKRDSINLR